MPWRQRSILAEHVDGAGLFNIGSSVANTWRTLIESIFAALGREPEIEFIDMPEYLRPKYQYFTRAQIEKLRAAGYRAEITPLAGGCLGLCSKLFSSGVITLGINGNDLSSRRETPQIPTANAAGL